MVSPLICFLCLILLSEKKKNFIKQLVSLWLCLELKNWTFLSKNYYGKNRITNEALNLMLLIVIFITGVCLEYSVLVGTLLLSLFYFIIHSIRIRIRTGRKHILPACPL